MSIDIRHSDADDFSLLCTIIKAEIRFLIESDKQKTQLSLLGSFSDADLVMSRVKKVVESSRYVDSVKFVGVIFGDQDGEEIIKIFLEKV